MHHLKSIKYLQIEKKYIQCMHMHIGVSTADQLSYRWHSSRILPINNQTLVPVIVIRVLHFRPVDSPLHQEFAVSRVEILNIVRDCTEKPKTLLPMHFNGKINVTIITNRKFTWRRREKKEYIQSNHFALTMATIAEAVSRTWSCCVQLIHWQCNWLLARRVYVYNSSHF